MVQNTEQLIPKYRIAHKKEKWKQDGANQNKCYQT